MKTKKFFGSLAIAAVVGAASFSFSNSDAASDLASLVSMNVKASAYDQQNGSGDGHGYGNYYECKTYKNVSDKVWVSASGKIYSYVTAGGGYWRTTSKIIYAQKLECSGNQKTSCHPKPCQFYQ